MNKQIYVLTFLGFSLLILLASSVLYDVSPIAIQLENLFAEPSLSNWFGTDELGRDILSRLSRGVMTSLTVAFSVLLLAGSIGVLVGILSGWFGGIIDIILMRITDVFLSFPGILIAIAFAALAGPGIENVILALGLLGWVSFARLSRVQTMALKNEDYINASMISGVRLPVILYKYILPNIAAPLIVESIFTAAGAMIAEAGLSFLGIGIQPPDPSLGAMLREGARYMLNAPHLVLAPGLTLMLLVLTFYLLGDISRDFLDKKKQAEHIEN